MARQYDFIVGPETSTQPDPVTPSAGDDLITRDYADARYTQGQTSVADIAAIKAIAAADRTDGDLISEKSTNLVYMFNATSTDTGDDDTVLQPTAGSGRWIKIGGSGGGGGIGTFDSVVEVSGHTGFGSTNLVINRYTTTVTNTGSDITYAQSASLGDSFTINADGLYEIIVIGGRGSGNGIQGFSVNSAELTVESIGGQSVPSAIGAFAMNAISGIAACATRTMLLENGDVVRPHCDGNNSGSVTAYFRIRRVG